MYNFPTTIFDIPTLLEDKQAEFIDLPVRGWGSVSRRSRMRGTWHFYIDDSKFTALWKKPHALFESQAFNCVEVNFSTFDQTPFAVGLFRVFQKRWLARFWQESGIGIFVDLNVDRKFDTINLLGVPKGWKAYATAAADNSIDLLQHHYELACDHAESKDIRMMVYGGGKKVRKFCGENNLVYIQDARNEARKKNA